MNCFNLDTVVLNLCKRMFKHFSVWARLSSFKLLDNGPLTIDYIRLELRSQFIERRITTYMGRVGTDQHRTFKSVYIDLFIMYSTCVWVGRWLIVFSFRGRGGGGGVGCL